VLTHSYASNALLQQLTSSLGTTLISSPSYNALNLPTQYTLGSGTTAQVRHTYYGPDAAGSPYGALRTIQLQQGAAPMLVNRTLTYDPVGNVTQIVDGVNGETGTFGYDDLDRLTSASGPVIDTFVYSPIGNLTQKAGQTVAYGDGAHKHAATSWNGTSYGYDANGCMTTRNAAQGNQTIKYDPERRSHHKPISSRSRWRTASRVAGVTAPMYRRNR
jgi:YD repeat-containing protein